MSASAPADSSGSEGAFKPPATEEDGDLAGLVSLKVGVASRAFDQAAAQLFRDHAIKPEHVMPLLVMAAQPGMKQTEYAQMLHLDVTTFGRYADQLARQGLLTRSRSQQDRRAMLLRVTGPGAALAGRVHAALAEVERAIARRLGASSVAALRNGLGAFTEAIEEIDRPT